MADSKQIHIGTSGWHYDHWKGPFYPEDVAKDDFLKYYADHFETAEINNSFYQLPDEDTLKKWRQTVSSGFLFSVKASRYITHMKKLKEPKESLSNLLSRIDTLGSALGPVLFQLPPNWNCNPERLKKFLELLPDGKQYTFEFRDTSWFDDEVYALLKEYRSAFCIYHLEGRLSPKEITADFVYIRLHGPEAAYEGRYDTDTLSGWAGAISSWNGQGKDVYCYFDNDQRGYAVQNALELQNMLAK